MFQFAVRSLFSWVDAAKQVRFLKSNPKSGRVLLFVAKLRDVTRSRGVLYAPLATFSFLVSPESKSPAARSASYPGNDEHKVVKRLNRPSYKQYLNTGTQHSRGQEGREGGIVVALSGGRHGGRG